MNSGLAPLRMLRVGEDSLLVETEDVTGLYAAALAAGVAAADVVPAARTVLFAGVPSVPALEAELAALALASLTPASGGPAGEAPAAASPGELTVPVLYDGADLEAVARLWGMTSREVVATHTGTQFTVAFCGFAPGFAYCTGLPDELAVPRLDSPRTVVPAGAVGLAGAFTGVYPTASPGGWRLLGRTPLTLWDPARDRPATLAPGTRVRFEEAS